MAFENLKDTATVLVEAGHTEGARAWVEQMDVTDPLTSTIKAGLAVTQSAGLQIPFDGTKFFGVNVVGQGAIGQQCEDVPNAEVCVEGYVFVVMKAGVTQPLHGEFASPTADGTFEASNALTVGVFTGIHGKPTADGNLVAQLRIQRGA